MLVQSMVYWHRNRMLYKMEEYPVALKPILQQALLTTAARLPLRTSCVKINRPEWTAMTSRLDRRAEEGTLPAAQLEAAVRLDYACGTSAAIAYANRLLDAFSADALTQDRLTDAVALMRAAWALYEATVDRALLEKMMAFAAWLYAHEEETEACRPLRVAPADCMELLTNLYRVTARKSLLKLLDRLRGSSMKWDGVLHAFDVQSPMKKLADADTLRLEMAQENSEEGFYTRQYLTCHGETLADGARSALAVACFTGSKHAETAAEAGWSRMMRWHGNALGMIGADETLAGKAPTTLMDTAAIGAWIEAFAAHAPLRKNGWAMDAMERLLLNSLPLLVTKEQPASGLRLNVLTGEDDEHDAFLRSADHAERSMTRLARAMAAAASAAVNTTETGADVLLLLSGSYAFRLGGAAAVMTVQTEESRALLRLKLKTPAKGAIRIRIPVWMGSASVQIGRERLNAKAGSLLVLDALWQKEETIELTWTNRLKMESGHHQGVSVWLGAKLMALPVLQDTAWAVAVCGRARQKDGAVLLPVQPIDWRHRGVLPNDVPVLPRPAGDRRWIELKPVAETEARITVFPLVAEA